MSLCEVIPVRRGSLLPPSGSPPHYNLKHLRMESLQMNRTRWVSLQAEDDSQFSDRQADRSRQLQLVLQETPHLLREQNVTEHPDLRPLPLDVGVTRRQPGAPDGPAQRAPHLEGVGRGPTGEEPSLKNWKTLLQIKTETVGCRNTTSDLKWD